MEKMSQVDSASGKTKTSVWGIIYNFLLCGGWLLVLVAILVIALYLDK
jgi:hypothetical protein